MSSNIIVGLKGEWSERLQTHCNTGIYLYTWCWYLIDVNLFTLLLLLILVVGKVNILCLWLWLSCNKRIEFKKELYIYPLRADPRYYQCWLLTTKTNRLPSRVFYFCCIHNKHISWFGLSIKANPLNQNFSAKCFFKARPFIFTCHQPPTPQKANWSKWKT